MHEDIMSVIRIMAKGDKKAERRITRDIRNWIYGSPRRNPSKLLTIRHTKVR